MKNEIYPYQFELLAAMVCYTVTEGQCWDYQRLGKWDYEYIYKSTHISTDSLKTYFSGSRKPPSTHLDILCTYTEGYFGYNTWADFVKSETKPELQSIFHDWNIYKKRLKNIREQEKIEENKKCPLISQIKNFVRQRLSELLEQNQHYFIASNSVDKSNKLRITEHKDKTFTDQNRIYLDKLVGSYIGYFQDERENIEHFLVLIKNDYSVITRGGGGRCGILEIQGNNLFIHVQGILKEDVSHQLMVADMGRRLVVEENITHIITTGNWASLHGRACCGVAVLIKQEKNFDDIHSFDFSTITTPASVEKHLRENYPKVTKITYTYLT